MSKKILKSSWFVVVALILTAGVSHQALASESIEEFNVGIDISKDANVQIVEKIVYDFGSSERHGIYRDIPYKYKARGGNYVLAIENIKVVDEAGYAYQFKEIRSGGNLRIQIGDPEKYVSGRKVYIIEYSVTGAINFFQDHDELYWNVTGNDWQVSIKNVSTRVGLPEMVERSQVQISCFAGGFGSANSCDDLFYLPSEAGISKAGFVQDSLSPGEGMTVVVGVPKGIIREPSLIEKIKKVISDNWIVAIPFVTLGFLYYVWRRYGRDPQGQGVIVPQYDPPTGLSPSQVGTIIDERVDQVDISADIVHLAVGGYLKIRRLEEKKFLSKKIDYELVKLKAADSDLSKPEGELFSKLFEKDTEVVKLSGLKNKFYRDWAKVRSTVYKSVVEKNYFPKNPSRVRSAYAAGGLILLGVVGGMLSFFLWGALGAVSMVISGLMVALFGIIMPVKTKEGVMMKEYILGLKMYLSVAEKERLKFHNAPEKSPELFDRLLPFAMVLKVEKEWAREFEDIYREPPKWYEGPAGTHFNSVLLVSNIGDFSTAAQNNLSSSPSSAAHGGSGFSGGGVGGGFGGGGGGSW